MIEIPIELQDKPLRVIAEALKISHETVRRAQNRAQGKCELCRGVPVTGRHRCLQCIKTVRKGARKASGHKPWKPGGLGRRPIEHATA